MVWLGGLARFHSVATPYGVCEVAEHGGDVVPHRLAGEPAILMLEMGNAAVAWSRA